MNNNYWFLQNIDLFKILCPHKFGNYKTTHEFKKLKKDEFIYMEGDHSNKVYLIAEGKVKIGYYTDDGKEVLKAILSKGEIFGEMAILGEKNRNEFAQALDSTTELCSMSVEILKELMLEDKTLTTKIYKWIGMRLQKVERKIELLVFKDVRTRLIEFISELESEYGTKKNGFIVIKHSYTQKNIADLIGSSRQTVSSLLNEFQSEGLIKIKRGKFILNKSFN